MTVDEIRKKTIERLIESRKKAGQDGYNEKKSKEYSSSKYADSKAVGVDFRNGKHYLIFAGGDEIKVSKEKYELTKKRLIPEY